jgi:fructosamine-3-kinase
LTQLLQDPYHPHSSEFHKFLATPATRVHGGSINTCYRWEGAAGPIFVKLAALDQREAFAAEAAGLETLRRAAALRVPRVLGVGASGSNSWLALEWIPFGMRSRAAEVLLGELFRTYQPQPSLLHGDLWGGNWATDDRGRPVLFDPAVYYGDREADLAMTRLFGGFGAEFYSAYQATWPLDPGWSTRVELYNLYHVLNHLNFFGAGYLAQAVAMIDDLMAELGH